MRLLLTVLLFSGALLAQEANYPTSAEIRADFEALAKSEPKWCQVEELPGKVPGLYAVRLARFAEPANRPAIVILGSLRGDELSPGYACLALAERMLSRSKPDLPILFGAWLQVMDVIFIPTPCAASRDLMLGDKPTALAGVMAPLDDDRDLQTDEDGPEDINGDGVISQMRVKRQGGRFRESTRDARVLIECAAGELGQFDILWEGEDNDRDGDINEDGKGTITLANDFAIRWSDKQPGANRFSMGTAESRALAEYFVAHPNIAVAINMRSLGERLSFAGGPPQGTAAPSRGGRRAEAAPADNPAARDKLMCEAIQKAYLEATRSKVREGEDSEGAGNVADWFYEACGAYAMNLYLAKTPEPDGEKPKREEPQPTKDEAAQLLWLSYTPDRYLEWKTFKHPQLGEIEIGGWRIDARKDVKPADLQKTIEPTWIFLYDLAAMVARPRITRIEAKDLGNGTFKIRLSVSNHGTLDYKPAFAAQNKIGLPLFVELGESKKIELVSGTRKQSVENLQAGAAATFEWVVRAKDPWDFMDFTLSGQRADQVKESKSPKGCEEWKD